MSPIHVTFRRTIGLAHLLYTTLLAVCGFLAACAAFLAFNLDAAEGLRVRLVPLWTVSVAPALPVLAALIGMDAWSDDRKTGRIDLLLSAPVRERDLVIGKFLGVWTVVFVAVLLALLSTYLVLGFYAPSLLEDVSPVSFLPGIIALMLQGALWCAVSVATSTFFRNSAATAFTTIALLVALPRGIWYALMAWAPQGRPNFGEMPLDAQVYDFASGLVSTAMVLTYLMLTILALFVASKSVASLRLGSRGAAGVRYSSRMAMALAGVFTILAILLAYRLDATLDLPVGGEEARFSPRSRNVLASSQGTIMVTAFLERKDDRFREVGHFLRSLAAEADAQCGIRFVLRFVDPTLDLGAATRLVRAGVEKDSIVFERDGRIEFMRLKDGFGERDCISLIERMTVPFQRSCVYWTAHHGEAAISDYGPDGLSDIARDLERAGYVNRVIDLANDKESISNDCALVVVAGPRTDFADIEMNRLTAYLNGTAGEGNGGRLLVLLDSDELNGFQTLLSQWGARPECKELVGTRTLTGMDVIVKDFATDHPVSSPFKGEQVILDDPLAFEAVPADRKRPTNLLLAGGECLAVAVEGGGEVAELFRPARVIAIGDSGFVRNGRLAAYANANRDFFQNCVKFLSGRDAMTESGLETDRLDTKMDRDTKARFVIVSTVLIPMGLFLLLGGFVARRRRRS